MNLIHFASPLGVFLNDDEELLCCIVKQKQVARAISTRVSSGDCDAARNDQTD
jgi:hypothetical protein